MIKANKAKGRYNGSQWVVRALVLDAKKLQAHAPLAAEAIEAHGGSYLARGGAHETTQGSDFGCNVIV